MKIAALVAGIFGLLLLVGLSRRDADATVTVNKTFSPTSIAIGGAATVTVLLQNTDTGADARIVSLRDDIGSMVKAILDTHGPTTGVCSGAEAVPAPPAPSLANNVYSVGPFVIPKATSVSAPATCTLTFQVLGNQAGNGFNTIAAGDVVVDPATDNPSAITQTLTVTSVNATIATGGNVTASATAAANLTYTIRNPAAGIALTNAGFGIDVNSTAAYSIGGVTNTCGATLTTALPITTSPKTLTFAGGTIGAGGMCSVTIPVTGAAGVVVNTVFSGNSLTDDQLVTNADAASAAATFSDRKPVLAKWFTPPFVQPAGAPAPAITQSRLSIHITNPLPAQPLTHAGITDAMPAGITLVSAPSPQCGGGTVSIASNVLQLSGATIGPVPCLLTAIVTATTGALNTLDKAAFTSDQVTGAANDAQARLYVTDVSGNYFMSKQALGSAPNQPIGSYGVNMPFQFELDFSSVAGSDFSGGTVADDLGTLPMATRIVDDGGAHKPTSSANCGAPHFTDTNGGATISATGVTIPAGATCRVKFWVQFTSTTATAQTGTNTAQATFGGIALTANANVTELPTLYVQNYTASNQGLVNQPLTVAGQIRDDAGTPDTGAVAIFKLDGAVHPHSVVLAPAPNFTFAGCPSGLAAANIAIDSSREFFTVNVPGAIVATCTIGYDVINEVAGAAGAGTFVAGDSTYTGDSTPGVQTATTGIGFAEFSTSSITPSKQFIPNNIQAGAPATAQIALTVAGVFGSAQTIAKNVQFTDTLPAGITFSGNPNPTFSGCGATPSATIAGSGIAFTGMTLTAAGASSDVCTVRFQVTSSIVGAPPPNVIPVGSITTATGGITNALAVQASLTVVNGIGVQKTFVAPTLPIGDTDFARFLLSNSVATTPLSGGLTDRLPPNLQLTSTTLGPAIPGDPVGLCGGTVSSGAVGVAGATIALGGLTVPPYDGTTRIPGQCAVYLALGASASAAPGTPATNTIGPGDVTIGGVANLVGSSASITFTAAANVGLSTAFLPATIVSGATSVLTISVSNTAANAAGLTGLNVSAALPANVTLAATPNASTTCPGGALSAIAGSASIGLAGGSLAANATCTIAVSVSGAIAGIYTNTIPANAVVSNQGATNGAPASAVLNIGNSSGVTLVQSFTPALIAVNGTSVVQIVVNNELAGAVPLSALALDDALPPNVVIAPTPNASTTCTGGLVSAVAGGTVVGLAGGSVPANASCTITVSVMSGIAGIYVSTIPANALSDAQASTNAGPAQATLDVGNAGGVGIAKSFTPATIPVQGTSLLTISIVNPSSALALSGLALADALPAGVFVAPAPNAATSCGAGVVGAIAGGGVVSLSGGALPANAACAITVSVTAAAGGIYPNTIAANALTAAQASTNGLPAAAILNVANTSGVALHNAFGPAVIAPHGMSALTITLANSQPNAVPLTALNLVDNLPANLSIAATPNASTTCGGGAVGAAAAGTVVTLSGVTMGPNSTCTVTVTVTGTIPNTYANTIPAGAIHTAQGAANAAPATAELTIGQPALGLTKTSVPSAAGVSPGEAIAYTVSVKNNGTQPETNARVTDVMTNAALVPGSVTIDGHPMPDRVVTAGQPFGTIPVGATATLVYRAAVNLSAPAGATVTNAATISGDQPCTLVGCSATSPFNTVAPPVLNATKLIDGQASESVLAGQTVAYTITIANTGTSPAANTTIADPLPNGVTIIPGTVTLNGVPVLAATVSGQTLTIPVGQIAAGTSAVAAFNAKLGPTAGNAANTASVTAAGLARPVVSTTATAHRVPATLTVTKTASATTVSAGDRVDFQIAVAPVGGVAYGATTFVDSLPGGEVYAPGTARVNGKPATPAQNGHRLTWTLPILGAHATIAYSTVIAPGVQQNAALTNVVDVTAVAPGHAGLGRGSGSASVLVTQSTFGSCYPITGRVYLDRRGSGRFEDPDVGVAGVNLYLDNGENVTTDTFGRYDFPCVHPGMHALRLDETTLPAGAAPYDDRNIDSEKSTRRLVHHIYDTTIIEDVNFAVRGTHGNRSQ